MNAARMEHVSLIRACDEHLTKARQASSGRSAQTVHGGHDHSLRQTILALAAGRELAEHDSPGEATLHVLVGHVRLRTDGDSWDLEAGDYMTIPPERHALAAESDSVVMLTVATSA